MNKKNKSFKSARPSCEVRADLLRVLACRVFSADFTHSRREDPISLNTPSPVPCTPSRLVLRLPASQPCCGPTNQRSNQATKPAHARTPISFLEQTSGQKSYESVAPRPGNHNPVRASANLRPLSPTSPFGVPQQFHKTRQFISPF